MGIYFFLRFAEKMWGRVITPLLKALKPPVRQLRNGFSKSAQNFDLETFWPRWLVKSELFLGLTSAYSTVIQTPKYTFLVKAV